MGYSVMCGVSALQFAMIFVLRYFVNRQKELDVAAAAAAAVARAGSDGDGDTGSNTGVEGVSATRGDTEKGGFRTGGV
jgi:hypothetical protein